MFRLYATGNNAWNQLTFADTNSAPPITLNPPDMDAFTVVLESHHHIELVATKLTYTLIKKDSKLLLAGCPPNGLISSDTELHDLTVVHDGTRSFDINNSVVTLNALCNNVDVPQYGTQTIVQMYAYDTGLLVLLDQGSVWVYGDPRFPACLGIPSNAVPPITTSVRNRSLAHVKFFNDVGPVVKISAGGYTLAALTESGDLYVWGGRPGQKSPFEDISDYPELVDSDVKDVAIGGRHALVLGTDGEVSGKGSNDSGQLGKAVEDWPGAWSLHLELMPGEVVDQVHAGPHTSFLITNIHV